MSYFSPISTIVQCKCYHSGVIIKVFKNAKMHKVAGFCNQNLEIFLRWYHRKSAPGAWTQTTISAWLAGVPIVSVFTKRPLLSLYSNSALCLFFLMLLFLPWYYVYLCLLVLRFYFFAAFMENKLRLYIITIRTFEYLSIRHSSIQQQVTDLLPLLSATTEKEHAFFFFF